MLGCVFLPPAAFKPPKGKKTHPGVKMLIKELMNGKHKRNSKDRGG